MAVQASKLISLTDKATGTAFKLSANKITQFTVSGSTDTLITYLTNDGVLKTQLVDETVAAINTAAARTQALTFLPQGNITTNTVVYLHSDKIIFIDATGSDSIITYDAGLSAPVHYLVDEVASAINTAAGNTFAVTIQQSGLTRYINNLFVDLVSTEGVGSLPTFTPTYKIKLETVALTVQGSGYTAATVAFSGGGTGATLPTATATVAAGAVTQITINTAGSNITADVLVTINGDGTGATAVDKIHHILDTLTLATAGSNLNTAPTITFAAGTVTAAATINIDTTTQKATSATITNVGSYVASAFPPAITYAGGTGCQITYDAKGSAFIKLEVAETAATVQTAVNAL
jgi:hypothetical protein